MNCLVQFIRISIFKYYRTIHYAFTFSVWLKDINCRKCAKTNARLSKLNRLGKFSFKLWFRTPAFSIKVIRVTCPDNNIDINGSPLLSPCLLDLSTDRLYIFLLSENRVIFIYISIYQRPVFQCKPDSVKF